MTDEEIEYILHDLFCASTLADYGHEPFISLSQRLSALDWVCMFRELDAKTTQRGVVLRMKDGREFQINIHQTR